MPELVLPTVAVHDSFLAAMKEFAAEGRGGEQDSTMIGREIRLHGLSWNTPVGFAAFVEAFRAAALDSTPRPDWMVPSTTLWYVSGPEYHGRLAIRHRLTPSLLEKGGHIGYDVRPSARRRGYATAMLRDALPFAAELGLDRVLVTCDWDNVASRKVIEANGGVFEDQREERLRFWITPPRPDAPGGERHPAPPA